MYRIVRQKGTKEFVRLFQTATQTWPPPEHWPDPALLPKPSPLPAQPQQCSF